YKNPKGLNYAREPRDKSKDTYDVTVSNPNNANTGSRYPYANAAFESFNKLKNNQPLSISDYINLLLGLPLKASPVGRPDVIFYLDSVTSGNLTDGKLSKVEKMLAVLNIFPLRVQIINSLLQNQNAKINLNFSKQLTKGILNVNRDVNNKSIMSNISTL